MVSKREDWKSALDPNVNNRAQRGFYSCWWINNNVNYAEKLLAHFLNSAQAWHSRLISPACCLFSWPVKSKKILCKIKHRHRRWAALLGFDSGQRLMYPRAKPSEHHKGIIIYLSEQHIKTYCRKYTLSTHWKAKIQRFNSCFWHVTTLRSSSAHTGLISSKVLVHLTGFYVLHKPSRAECCPVNGPKRSTSKLVFSSSIRFQPKTKEPTDTVRSPWHCLTTPSKSRNSCTMQIYKKIFFPSSNLPLSLPEYFWEQLHVWIELLTPRVSNLMHGLGRCYNRAVWSTWKHGSRIPTKQTNGRNWTAAFCFLGLINIVKTSTAGQRDDPALCIQATAGVASECSRRSLTTALHHVWPSAPAPSRSPPGSGTQK